MNQFSNYVITTYCTILVRKCLGQSINNAVHALCVCKLDQARAKELLSQQGIVVQRVDVCDDRLVHRILTSHHVTHVVHLAAQAGVRYSVKDPIAYVTANVECFTKLLVLLDEFPVCTITSQTTSNISLLIESDRAIQGGHTIQ